jgi:hypothetical protein
MINAGGIPTEPQSDNRGDAFHGARLSRFVARARRIEKHSIYGDMRSAMQYSNSPVEIILNSPAGELDVVRVVPPEELLESLAARVRPLLLTKETVHLEAVFKSVRFFARKQQHEKILDHLAVIHDGHRNRLRGAGGEYVIQQLHVGDEVWAEMTNQELAESWLYGDVVHADEEQIDRASSFGINERYAAAVSTYVHVGFTAIALLNMTRELKKLDESVCSTEALEDDVVASIVDGRINVFMPGSTVAAYVAPVGTPPPKAGDLPTGNGPRWRVPEG